MATGDGASSAADRLMHGTSLLTRVTGALGALLVIAFVTRVAWELLRPVVPGLLVLVGLLGIVSFVTGRNRRW